MTEDEGLEESKELVGNSAPQRNWRGILIALLVILIVCSLIVTAVILVTPKHKDVKVGDPFTFDDLFSPDFQPRHFTSKWIGDKDVFVYRSREGELMEYDAEENVTRLIMDNSTFRRFNTDVYYISEDLNFILLAYDIEKVYRHSFRAKYTIYNRYATNTKDRLLPFPQSSGATNQWKDKSIQYAGWSPKGSGLTFVVDNNLYYQQDPHTTPNRITLSGEEGKIFNGIPDWVYEEEILHSNVAHYWSPDSEYICYMQFDDTDVPLYQFPYYGKGDNIYGSIDSIAYPKAGDVGPNINPRVSLYIMETANTGVAQKRLNPPAQLANQDNYVTMVTWQDNNHVMVVWSNRAQNRSIITLCDAISADCYVNQMEVASEGKGWVLISKPLFMNGGQRYLALLSQMDGHHGYWKHIAMVTTPIGQEGIRTYLTQGTWDITDLAGYDEENKQVYYISTNEDPRKRHLFRVGVMDSTQTKMHEPECLTCDYPETCQYVSTKFSKSSRYYILNCEGPDPPSYILKSTLDERNIVLESNSELKARLAKKALPVKEYFEIETEDGAKIWAQVYIPPAVKKDLLTEYPMLVHTYGGPGTQKVTEQFNIGWSTYLTSSERIVYASIDGRGSAARGDRFLHAIHHHLGTIEVQDQLVAGKFFADNLPYVDSERMGIWGWSYGGFVTAHAMGDRDYPDVYRCGVAVAPVTDWRYYDTVYTERYMGLASENYKGYDKANVSSKAGNYAGKNFMLVHGTADDNVHFQHSAQFVKALTEAEIDFRIQLYTDKNHAISGPKTSRHLYRQMTRFIKQECWDGGRPRIDGEEIEYEEY